MPPPDDLRRGKAAREVQRSLTTGVLLTELARRGRLNIHARRDGWIAVRSTAPYDWEGQSIDPAWIRETFGDIADGKFSFGTATARSAATTLTRDQARALGDHELGFLSDAVPPGELLRARSFWRLVAALSTQESKALLAGTPLEYSTLSAGSRTAFRRFLGEASEDGDGAPYDLELSANAISGLELVLHEAPQAPPTPAVVPVSFGTYRTMELRLGRPMMSLLSRQVCCNWN